MSIRSWPAAMAVAGQPASSARCRNGSSDGSAVTAEVGTRIGGTGQPRRFREGGERLVREVGAQRRGVERIIDADERRVGGWDAPPVAPLGCGAGQVVGQPVGRPGEERVTVGAGPGVDEHEVLDRIGSTVGGLAHDEPRIAVPDQHHRPADPIDQVDDVADVGAEPDGAIELGGRSPRPVSVGVRTRPTPPAEARARTRDQHQAPCQAPCTSTMGVERAWGSGPPGRGSRRASASSGPIGVAASTISAPPRRRSAPRRARTG